MSVTLALLPVRLVTIRSHCSCQLSCGKERQPFLVASRTILTRCPGCSSYYLSPPDPVFAEHIARAKRAGKLGLMLGFRRTSMFGEDLAPLALPSDQIKGADVFQLFWSDKA